MRSSSEEDTVAQIVISKIFRVTGNDSHRYFLFPKRNICSLKSRQLYFNRVLHEISSKYSTQVIPRDVIRRDDFIWQPSQFSNKLRTVDDRKHETRFDFHKVPVAEATVTYTSGGNVIDFRGTLARRGSFPCRKHGVSAFPLSHAGSPPYTWSIRHGPTRVLVCISSQRTESFELAESQRAPLSPVTEKFDRNDW